MSTFARIRQNWKLIVLLITLVFAASPLAIGLIFKETALEYATFTTNIVVLTMIATVMGFSRGEKAASKESAAVVEYAILVTALHIVGVVAFCLEGVPALTDISAASMFVFGFMLIVIMVKIDALK